VREYAWAIDLELCVFPQEGLLNNPGTDALMMQALAAGGRVVGAAPYTDSDPRGQIDRVFDMARHFDIDMDMHLDFSTDASSLDLDHVCDMTDRFRYGGGVAIGHVTKLSAVDPARFAAAAKRMADSGVALIRAANLYANIAHVGARGEMCECLDMISRRAAPLLRLSDHGVREGAAADLVVLDATDRAAAIAELAPPLQGFERGRQTFERRAAKLLRPA
jgi:cytosine/creatinine deaminase